MKMAMPVTSAARNPIATAKPSQSSEPHWTTWTVPLQIFVYVVCPTLFALCMHAEAFRSSCVLSTFSPPYKFVGPRRHTAPVRRHGRTAPLRSARELVAHSARAEQTTDAALLRSCGLRISSRCGLRAEVDLGARKSVLTAPERPDFLRGAGHTECRRGAVCGEAVGLEGFGEFREARQPIALGQHLQHQVLA